MKLTILGSGTVIPYPKRGNSGYLLQTENHTILIDGGAGALRNIADFGLNYRDIDIITYTHIHPDHCFDLIPFLFALNNDSRLILPKSIDIITPRDFQKYFNRLMDIYGEWVLKEGIEVSITEAFQGKKISFDDFTLQCGHTEHTDHSVTYRFKEHGGGNLFYSGDTDYCQELVQSAMGVDVLILECSFPDELKKMGHLTPSECGQIAAETGCKKLVLTHFYPEILETDIKKKVQHYYNGEIILAYDGLEIEI